MKSKILICLTSIYILSISGCKKYEEGPYFITKSKCKRITGTWHLEYLVIDGVDSTVYAYNHGCTPIMTIKPYDDLKTSGRIFPYSESIPNSNCYAFVGTFSLLKNKKYLHMFFDYVHPDSIVYHPVGPYLVEGGNEWEIRKLTNDQLWLSITYNDKYCWWGRTR